MRFLSSGTEEAFATWGGGHDVFKGNFHRHRYWCPIADRRNVVAYIVGVRAVE